MPLPTRRSGILRACDIFITLCVLTPLTVVWWAGTWQLIDSYVYPQSPWISYWISLGCGNLICFACYFINPPLASYIQTHRRPQSLVAIWLFNYAFSLGQLNTWRGVWEISDVLIKQTMADSLTVLLTVVVLSEVSLILLRTSINTLGLPFWINTEIGYKFDVASPRFRSKIDDCWWYCADVLVTQLLVTSLVVQVWRGVWDLLTSTLSPDYDITFHLICAGIGGATCLLIHSVSYPVYLLSRRLSRIHWLLEHVCEVLVTMLAAVSSLVLWVACWQMLEEDVIKQFTWRAGVFHAAGFTCLALLHASSSLAPTGVGVDGEAGQGLGVWWHVSYVTAWIHWRQQVNASELSQRGSIQQADDDTQPIIQPHTQPDSLPHWRTHILPCDSDDEMLS